MGGWLSVFLSMSHIFSYILQHYVLCFLSFLACQGRIEPMECIAPYKKTLLLLLLLLLLFLSSILYLLCFNTRCLNPVEEE